MFNTVFMCVMSMLLTCVAAAMGGYALAKKRFNGPGGALQRVCVRHGASQAGELIPLLKEMAFLNLHNTLWAVIFPTVGWPFGVFLMKQFSKTSRAKCWRRRASTARARQGPSSTSSFP